MQNKVIYKFHGQLNDFVVKRYRNKTIEHTFDNFNIVKDSIESFGVPHPEVAVILVNNNRVLFDYKVKNDDQIEIFPYFNNTGIEPIVPIKPNSKPKFILDVHLGGLARYLRMAGFDVLYNSEDWGDKYIADTGGNENRIVLSRDKGLLKRSSVVYGYFVRNKDSFKQFEEITYRYDLEEYFEPFTRCIKCNGNILSVEKKDIISLIEEGTRNEHDKFWQCGNCKQIYWKGTHYKRMVELIKNA